MPGSLRVLIHGILLEASTAKNQCLSYPHLGCAIGTSDFSTANDFPLAYWVSQSEAEQDTFLGGEQDRWSELGSGRIYGTEGSALNAGAALNPFTRNVATLANCGVGDNTKTGRMCGASELGVRLSQYTGTQVVHLWHVNGHHRDSPASTGANKATETAYSDSCHHLSTPSNIPHVFKQTRTCHLRSL